MFETDHNSVSGYIRKRTNFDISPPVIKEGNSCKFSKYNEKGYYVSTISDPYIRGKIDELDEFLHSRFNVGKHPRSTTIFNTFTHKENEEAKAQLGIGPEHLFDEGRKMLLWSDLDGRKRDEKWLKTTIAEVGSFMQNQIIFQELNCEKNTISSLPATRGMVYSLLETLAPVPVTRKGDIGSEEVEIMQVNSKH